MKRTALLLLTSVLSFAATAQGVATLNENFNSTCPTGGHHPNGWIDYNPIPTTLDYGRWTCTPDGRSSTGGASCTNYWGGAFHLDTAYLISPVLNFSSYTDSIYVRFDSKTTKIHLGGRAATLSLMTFTDSSYQSGIDIGTSLMNPLFGPDDSTDWVTHSINMHDYEAFGDFRLAFRFTGTDTTGSTWFLDNIYTTTSPLRVPNARPAKFKLSASGSCASGAIHVSYELPEKDPCELSIYDIVGRPLHRQVFTPINYADNVAIENLDLAAGVYIVRLSNQASSSVQKIFIH